jgi:hypothetical protein
VARALFNGGEGRFWRPPTPGMVPMAAVVAGAPPPGDGLAREAPTQWLNGGGMTWQWWLGFGVSRGHQGGVYIGGKCGMIRRDSKADFISNLILSSMIIRRIQKRIETSSLRSKTLLWVGVLWPYGWGAGPRAGGGSARCGTGSNMTQAGGGRRQPAGPDVVRIEARTGDSHPRGWAGIGPIRPTGVGLTLEKKKGRKKKRKLGRQGFSPK